MNKVILRQCEEMIRQGSSSFYKAFDGLPSPRREAVHVIYAFCRLIDDSVDEPWKSPYTIHELRSLFATLEEAEGHFIWPALRWLFHMFPHLSKEPFMLQMEGQLRDLEYTHYDTLEQLESYCYLVAGTVGEMLLPVLRDDGGQEAEAAGVALGIGMQLVNIVRDIGEDLGRGRRYIPLELMNEYNYTEAELESGTVNEALIALIGHLRERAAFWFRSGLRNVDEYPPESGMAVELAVAFYGAILDDVAAAGYDVFTRRAFVSEAAKRSMFNGIALRYARGMGGAGISAVH